MLEIGWYFYFLKLLTWGGDTSKWSLVNPSHPPELRGPGPQTEPARSTTRKQPTVAGSEELRRKILEILEMFREKWRF